MLKGNGKELWISRVVDYIKEKNNKLHDKSKYMKKDRKHKYYILILLQIMKDSINK